MAWPCDHSTDHDVRSHLSSGFCRKSVSRNFIAYLPSPQDQCAEYLRLFRCVLKILIYNHFMKTSIWWIRRDLRLHDNPSLTHALQQSEKVIPLFILDPALLSSPPSNRELFLYAALKSLDSELRIRNSRLVVRRGAPLIVLQRMVSETGASLIVAEADHSPYASMRDSNIGVHLPLETLSVLTVHPPQAVSKLDGTPYTVFTPFSKVWKTLPFAGKALGAPDILPEVPEDIYSEEIPAGKTFDEFPASENAARKRLSDFLTADIFKYQNARNMLSEDGTSRISPYLKFGLLSMRECVQQVRLLIKHTEDHVFRESCDTFLNELIWREFFISILAHFPHVAQQSFRENLRSIQWAQYPAGLRAWQEGRTGYPVVDAAMRQLLATGWMHNRARMISASFLTKDLLIDWREGEKWFMQHLIDGDLASNNGGWQWTAGTGTDAAPYFRIFNPSRQSEKFDPQGDYIRRWIPELSNVETQFIHTPWEFPQLEADYPPPMIDHNLARERTLAAYQNAKRSWEN